jgi:ferredoxin-nitrite reductase|eukprot:jgi/Chrpa1/187/Chrysochromulina_OHIO_Genome00001253-RA
MRYTHLAASVAALHATSALQLDHAFAFAPAPAVGRSRALSLKVPTGTSFLSEETIERAKTGNPIEKLKLAKDGTSAFTDVYEFAKAIRAGTLTWEEVEKNDLDQRLKWVGLLHRGKRTPGRFMMRLRTPNGIVTAEQMRFYAECVEPYGPEIGVVDITTRQNIQLRGVALEDADKIIDGLHVRNQTSFQSALDNVRNMVGSPLAGIDPAELVDTRPYCDALNDWYTIDSATGARGNPKWGNLPRKFNIAISGSRDDYAHTHINDIGLVPVAHKETGAMGFNVVLGGYMSIKRVAASIPMDLWLPAEVEHSVQLCDAILRIFRDEGARGDRQKARLMWLVEEYGVEKFREAVLAEMAKNGAKLATLAQRAQPEPETLFERRELLGVHAQPNPALVRVGVHVPVGRLSADECRTLAKLADEYSAGELRLTVEQNIILPNVPVERVDALLAEPALNAGRFSVYPGHIIGHTVSCTGAQFCGLALVETKNNADAVARKLEALVEVPRPLRIHWTGCPNSCGQVQVADIGIMGAPAKKFNEAEGKDKAVPGCDLFVGGKIGEHAFLSLEPYKKGIPLDHDDLVPELVKIIVSKFGGRKKEGTKPLAPPKGSKWDRLGEQWWTANAE